MPRSVLLAGAAWVCALAVAGCATTITGAPVRASDGIPGTTGHTSPAPPTEGSTTAQTTTSSAPTTSGGEPSGGTGPAPSASASPSGGSGSSAPQTSSAPASSAATASASSASASSAPVTSIPVTPDTTAAHSVATVDERGIITVRTPGGKDRVVIDKYEEPLCPPCGTFAASFGIPIARAVEDGTLTVRYHVAAFLDGKSASGDYSTRAYAAMLAVATLAGDQPGLFMAFHSMLYDKFVQPQENGATDLSDAELAQLARQAGAPDAVLQAITAEAQLPLARSSAARTLSDVQANIPSGGVPAVLADGTSVDIDDQHWLDDVLHR